jgi:hypothetical protein
MATKLERQVMISDDDLVPIYLAVFAVVAAVGGLATLGIATLGVYHVFAA